MAGQFACEADVTLGRLKHSWLENQILNKSAADVIDLRSGGGWSSLDQQFPRRIEEAADFVARIVDAFSPAQLVEKLGFFRDLSAEARDTLRSAVHRSYLAHSDIAGRKASLDSAVRILALSLDNVRRLWRDSSDHDLELAWGNVLRAAARLRDELDALPRGIVLP